MGRSRNSTRWHESSYNYWFGKLLLSMADLLGSWPSKLIDVKLEITQMTFLRAFDRMAFWVHF